MTQTEYYGLKKPATSDFVGPDAFNDNADAIDAALRALEEGKLAKDPVTDKLPESMLPPDPTAAKETPVDADWVTLTDTAASNARKKLTWAGVKATLKSYFDALYAAVGHTHAWSAIKDKPSSFAPSGHAATHKTGGADAIAPGDIGAALASHTHAPSDLTTPVPVDKGGTGATTAAAARSNLGAAANLLSDETAAAIWPNADGRPEEPTVDRALSKLSGSWKIGDTLTTLRTDLGDKWLLCNGAGISKAEYPALGNLLSTQGVVAGIVPTMQMPVSNPVTCDYGVSANIFAFVQGLTVYYTALPFGADTWHTSVISANSNMVITTLKFLNGKWIATGYKKETSSGAGDEFGYVFVNTAVDFSVSWSSYQVDSGNYFAVTGVTFGNGLYCISVYHYNSTSKAYYSWIYTSTNASSWTQRYSNTSNNLLLNNIVYVSNNFVALGSRKLDTYTNYAVLVFSTNGTSWTYKDTGLSARFYSVVYTGNTWFFGSDGKMYKTLGLSTTPTIVHNELTYRSEGVMVSSTDPDTIFLYGYEYVALYKVSTDSFSAIQNLAGISFDYKGGTQYSGYFILLQRSEEQNIYSTEYFSLPTISFDSVYTYIKALEE